VAGTPTAVRPLLTVSPNPFNPATTLAFHIEAAGDVRLTVHDLRSRPVRALTHRVLPAGDHTVRWDGKDDVGRPVAAGVYLARLVADRQVTAAKLVLIKQGAHESTAANSARSEVFTSSVSSWISVIFSARS
jgi:flagellar hook assembly protein FlgD